MPLRFIFDFLNPTNGSQRKIFYLLFSFGFSNKITFSSNHKKGLNNICQLDRIKKMFT